LSSKAFDSQVLPSIVDEKLEELKKLNPQITGEIIPIGTVVKPC